MYCALIVIVLGLKTFTHYDMQCGACNSAIKTLLPTLNRAQKFYKKNPIFVKCIYQEGV